MTDDMMDITIDGKTIDELGSEIDARSPPDPAFRQERKEARKLRRQRARDYEGLLLQRDAAISRANRMARVGNDLLWALEGYFDAVSADEPDAVEVSNWRTRIGDYIDDFDCAVGGV
jgi:hypothetical protein